MVWLIRKKSKSYNWIEDGNSCTYHQLQLHKLLYAFQMLAWSLCHFLNRLHGFRPSLTNFLPMYVNFTWRLKTRLSCLLGIICRLTVWQFYNCKTIDTELSIRLNYQHLTCNPDFSGPTIVNWKRPIKSNFQDLFTQARLHVRRTDPVILKDPVGLKDQYRVSLNRVQYPESYPMPAVSPVPWNRWIRTRL